MEYRKPFTQQFLEKVLNARQRNVGNWLQKWIEQGKVRPYDEGTNWRNEYLRLDIEPDLAPPAPEAKPDVDIEDDGTVNPYLLVARQYPLIDWLFRIRDDVADTRASLAAAALISKYDAEVPVSAADDSPDEEPDSTLPSLVEEQAERKEISLDDIREVVKNLCEQIVEKYGEEELARILGIQPPALPEK